MEHRFTLFTMYGTIIEREQHFNITAHFAYISFSRAQFTLSYVLIEGGEEFIQKFNDCSIFNADQIVDAVQIYALHQMPPAANWILQYFSIRCNSTFR